MKKRFLLLFLMCLLGGLGSSLMAQTTVTIDGNVGGYVTNTSKYVPFHTNYKYTTSQQIYLADELGMTNGATITNVAFSVKSTTTAITRTIKIYMVNTELERLPLTATNRFIQMSSSDLVYNGNITIDANNKWYDLKLLGDGFTYTGNNILLCVYDYTGVDTGKDIVFNTYNSKVQDSDGNNIIRGVYKYAAAAYDPTIADNCQINMTAGGNYMPQIKFTYTSGGSDDNTNPPTAVTDGSPNDYALGSNPQELKWTFGANTTKYQVLVGTKIEDGENGRVINTLGQQDFVEKGEGDYGSYSAEGLSAGTKYYWQVISSNDNGDTAGSVWNFTTVNAGPTDMVTKTYPENGASLKLTDVVLKWNYANDNHTRYTIYLGESADAMEELYSETDDKTEYAPNDLQSEKTYYWRVDVNNAIYTSKDTEVWCFTTQSVGNIDGIVKNNEAFVSGATISIKDLNGNLVGSTTTDAYGNFAFNDVVIGEYSLHIEAVGMEPYIINLVVKAGITSLGTIYLPSIIATDNSWTITNAELSENNELIVRANAVLQTTAKVGSLTIESGKSVTIKDGAVLTVVGEINNNGEIIIEDGGQLYQSNDNISATFKMGIKNPQDWNDVNNKDGWQFIASPFVDATTASFVPADGDYDLYKYEGKKDLEWVNYKKEISNSDDQPLVQIGEGEYYVNKYDKQAPLCDYYKYFASQTIYTSEEIGVEEGVVSSISYNLQSAYENTRSISIYMKNTERTESYSSWETLTSDLCVFSGEITYGATVGWFTIDLQNKFSYTGGNLLVTVIDNTGQYGGSNNFYSYETGPYNATTDIRTIYKNNGAYIDPLNITLGKSALTDNSKCLAPQIKLDFRTEVPFEESFVSGVGYLASYETEETATLSGKLFNEDNFKFKVSYNEEKPLANFHLLGNPFSFNMDWENISVENVYDGFAIVGDDGGYIKSTEGVIPVGDGFFVEAKGSTPKISYGASSKSRGEKSEYINVVATGKQGSNNVIVKLDGEEEDGFSKLENINPRIADVYVKNNGKQYSILSYNRNVTEVELFFDAKEMGNYNINIEPTGKFQSIVLVDRMTGIETNMLIDSYSFTATANDNPNRFLIKLVKGDPTSENVNFAYQSGEELIIDAEGMIQIVDVMGRIVYSNDVDSSNNRIDVSNFKSSAYIIRNIGDNGVRTQKIVIL